VYGISICSSRCCTKKKDQLRCQRQLGMKTNGNGWETTSPIFVTIFFTENRSGREKGGSENGCGIYGYTKTNEYEQIFTENERQPDSSRNNYMHTSVTTHMRTLEDLPNDNSCTWI
jgi:hypothetical protein